MSAVGSFTDSSQSFLFNWVSSHGVFVPTSVSSVGAASRLEAGAEALLSLALAVPLAFSLSFASLAFALSPLSSHLGLSALEAFGVGQFAALSKLTAASQPVWAHSGHGCCCVVVAVGGVIAKHRPCLVVPVLQLLLVNQVFVNVVNEGLVTPLGIIWVPFAEVGDLLLELF